MSKKVLVGATNFSKYGPKTKQFLIDNGFEIVENTFDKPFTKEQILERIDDDVFGVIAGCEEWDEEIFEKAKGLRVIGRFGIGVDNIDLESAKKHNVKVCNARGMNKIAVGEHTLALVLACMRDIVNLDADTRKGGWARPMKYNINGKVFGLVGFGAIAQYVAQLLSSFGCAKIYAFDAYPNYEAAEKLGVTMTDLDTIVKEADIITLHVPCTPETTKMFGKKQFEEMKDTAVLINVARGPVVDEKELYNALKEKKIAMAGLDVYEVEPTSADNPLFTLDNVIVMPHTAAETYETYESVSMFAAQVIADVAAGKEPKNWLNK